MLENLAVSISLAFWPPAVFAFILAIALTIVLSRQQLAKRRSRHQLSLARNQLASTAANRREIESKLSEREFFTARVLDTSPGLIYIFDLQLRRTTFINGRVHQLLGLTQTEFYELGDRFVPEFVHPEDQMRLVEHLATISALPSGQQRELEYRVRSQNGEWLWFLSRDQVFLQSADGRPIQILGTASDITQRKQDQQQLIESEQRFQRIADTLPQMVWVSRPDGNVLYFNKRWYDYMGCGPEHTLGDRWTARLHPDDLQRATVRWEHSVTTEQDYEIEYRFRKQSGEYRWFLGRALPIRDESGKIIQWFGTCTDIDDFKQAEFARHALAAELRDVAANLAEANRRKDEFLATLAHELRNPLATIRAGLEALKLLTDNPAAAEDIRGTMERQAKQLTYLINDLIDVSRVTRGQLKLRPQIVDLNRILRECIHDFEPNIMEFKHRLSVDLPDQPVQILADPQRMRQVFENLLSNAIKYTPPSGKIEIGMQHHKDFANIWVSDDGIGIPPDKLDSVFEMFTQLDRSTEKLTAGLGIGLTLVKQLVQLHDGSISASSAGVNHGCTFTVRLPLRSSKLTPIVKTKLLANVMGKTLSRRVLIVDDNAAAGNILGLVVTALGHQVQHAGDGLQAIELAESFRPEIVLMDIGMPKMNGIEAAKHIRNQPWGEKMVLIALTGWGQIEDKMRSKEAGFDHHLTKPAEPKQLESIFQTLP